MRILILGDICPTPHTEPYFAGVDMEALFGDFPRIVGQHDATLINLECAITDSEHKIKKFGPNLKAPVQMAQVLKKLGVDCCSLSNNHIFDFGIPGYLDTIAALDAQGICYTGFGENAADARKNFYLEQDGQRICVIAVCEHEYSYALPDRMGSRGFDPFETIADIRKAKEEADRVIVLYHGGKELCPYPSPRLQKACRAMVKAGADVVTCQHSHCIGCYEAFEGGHIVYGQGNFHFVKLFGSSPACWDTGISISYDTASNALSLIPHRVTETGIAPAQGEDAQNILAEMAQRDASLQDGNWLRGWQAFCEENREFYTAVIANAMVEGASPSKNHLFAHYLDCEAHRDVWQELFKTANHTNEI